jgi:hypothetical protein
MLLFQQLACEHPQLGRRRVIVDVSKIAALRAQGLGWRGVAITLGISERTVRRVAVKGGKKRE